MNAPANHRRSARFRPTAGAVCSFRMGPRQSVTGCVWDLSRDGVGILAPAPLAVGEAVLAEIAPGYGRPPVPVRLRVAHVRPLSTGDYLVGAAFHRPLSDDALRPFLRRPAAA